MNRNPNYDILTINTMKKTFTKQDENARMET